MPSVRFAAAVVVVFSMLLSSQSSLEARPPFPSPDHLMATGNGDAGAWKRLKDGQVIVDCDDRGDSKYVNARILINGTPSEVWRVLTNPFEFEKRISPRMKQVEVLQDLVDRSVLRCRVEVFPPILPDVTYTVESQYTPYEHVAFRRLGGTLKDFSGGWTLAPREDGRSTEVTYSMFVDPGLPIPQWIVRKAIRMELPRTLTALRGRVVELDTKNSAVVSRSILATRSSEIKPLR